MYIAGQKNLVMIVMAIGMNVMAKVLVMRLYPVKNADMRSTLAVQQPVIPELSVKIVIRNMVFIAVSIKGIRFVKFVV